MTRHSCKDCRQPIPNGQAHIRSRAFRQVAFCGCCMAIRQRIAEIVDAVRHGIAA
jgi:RNase P subunit RPR2